MTDKIITLAVFVLTSSFLLSEWLLIGNNGFNSIGISIILTAVAQIFLSVRKQNFSISLIHWFFVLLFFGVVPIIKNIFNVFPLVYINSQPEELLIASNYVIFTWCSIYSLGYHVVNTLKFGRIEHVKIESKGESGILILSTILYLLAGYVFVSEPLALFIRGGGIYEIFDVTMIALIFQYFCRPAAYFILLNSVISKASDQSNSKILSILLVLLFFLYNSPIATARFYAFAIWISLFGLYFLRKAKVGFKVLIVLSASVFGAELISGFRRGIDGALNAPITFDEEYWTSMTFDSYEMLASAIAYTQENGYLAGENFLGVLGFFIPRVLWLSKPIGSGAFLMEEFYKFNSPYGGFTNVSCPLVAESYLSFGLIGVIFASFFIGCLSKYLDGAYENGLKFGKERGVIIFRGYYFVVGGVFFFIMRGDLLSSFAYLTGITLSFFLVLLFAKARIVFREI